MEEVTLGWALKTGSGSGIWIWWGKKICQEKTIGEGTYMKVRRPGSFQGPAVRTGLMSTRPIMETGGRGVWTGIRVRLRKGSASRLRNHNQLLVPRNVMTEKINP